MSATDTPTQRASVVLHENGTGQVAIGEELFLLSGPDARANRAEARQKVAEHAKATAQSVEMQVTESGKSLLLLVGPDGRVSRAQAKSSAPEVSSAPSAASAPSPAPAQATDENGTWTQAEAPATGPESTPVRDEIADVPRLEGLEDLVQATPDQGRGAYAKSMVAREHSEDLPRGWDFSGEEGQPVSAEPVYLDPLAFESTESPESVTVGGVGHAVPASQSSLPEPGAALDPVDSDPRWEEISARPATQGIRGRLNGLGFHFAPAPDEVQERREELQATIAGEEQIQRAEAFRKVHEREQETRRQAREREHDERDRQQRALIQTNFDDGRTITMVNVKGGAGKTTAGFLIAATLGRVRGGGVVAWDANETRGTLGFRAAKDAHERTVVDLLSNADAFGTVEGSRLPTLMRYVRQQGDDQFVVLASDKDPEAQEMVDADGFRTVHEILERFMNVIVVDTGNNERAAHFLAAIEATDQLVIPISPGADSVAAAEWTMDALAARGHEDLVRHAIVLLQDSATRPGDGAEIAARFEGKVRQILPIPYDPALDGGTEIIFDELQPSTRDAFQEATAAIAQGLAETREN
ncbi:hypothetical protein Bra3105_18235 [Brachybacterium halotolerans subsp. kimchii]|uniref:hypothetical protein n=1 Tax=Brachybacterium halotolerans TaxID=2795215 RepID=UPI001E4DCBC6|nr:hypothetical protein [Brachybacterium halotolerans]UEJ82737.1 hypothetical protein Bra3105_18235 [Brachybacterium halotolerans subsp. kimchii]